jgi:TonB-dependent SusC/RagA subfamily outer membrane receptor
MTNHRLWLVAVCVVGAATIAADARAQAAPTGVVTGTVTDAESKVGISDVVVRILATTRVARTDATGKYRIVGVPTGPQRIQTNRLGYASASKPVVVSDAGASVVDFSLVTASVTLSRSITTAPSGAVEQARVNGASIGSVSVDSIVAAPITNFSELLNSRVAGVTVIQNSGEVGTGSRIVIRGQGSALLSNQPLIVIDGIRAYNNTNGFAFGLGGQTVSRFDDLDFENIETVEVLRGPAAAALYGTEAAAGVIVISTKRGQVDESPRFHVYGLIGRLNDYTKYPANYGRPGAGGGTCSLIDEFAGVCVGANGAADSTLSTHYNLVNGSPVFANGYDEGAGASVSGGGQQITYYTGFDWERQQGAYQDNSDRWSHANGGFSIHPLSILDIGLTAMYTQRRIVLPYSDNAVGGPLSGILLGSAQPGGYFLGLGPSVSEQIRNHEDVDRTTIGANGTLRILPWLTARGTVGMDYTQLFDYFYLQPAAAFLNTFPASSQDGAIYEYTGAASISAKYPIPGVSSLSGTTTFGGEWVDYSLHSVTGQGAGLLPGTGSVAGATSNFNATETNQDIVNIGGYLQQQFAWRNVLFLTASGRLDGNSAFGKSNSTALYPAGNLSYVVSDEPYWPKNDVITSLRFRFAGGQSGREPFFRLANGSFTGVSYNLGGAGNQTGFIPNTIGNADLKPERSTEYETGLDLAFWKDRFNVTATVFDRTERDLIQAVPVDISTGQTSVNTNLGEIDNRGLELTFSGRLFDSKPLAIDLSALLDVNRNKLVNLGNLTTPPTVANGVGGAIVQANIAGQPLGVFTSVPYTYADANHDGVIEPNEIHYGSKPVTIGEPGPRDELTLSPTITIFKYFKLNGQFDRRDGVTVYDGGDEFRCLFGFTNGRECNDPHSSLKDQAAAVAANFGGTDYGYILNGSFWKVREVSLKIIAPDAWVHRYLGGRDASFTISARNVATWTPYRGLDPEVNEFGGQPTLQNAQFFTQPPLRAIIARFDLTW